MSVICHWVCVLTRWWVIRRRRAADSPKGADFGPGSYPSHVFGFVGMSPDTTWFYSRVPSVRDDGCRSSRLSALWIMWGHHASSWHITVIVGKATGNGFCDRTTSLPRFGRRLPGREGDSDKFRRSASGCRAHVAAWLPQACQYLLARVTFQRRYEIPGMRFSQPASSAAR